MLDPFAEKHIYLFTLSLFTWKIGLCHYESAFSAVHHPSLLLSFCHTHAQTNTLSWFNGMTNGRTFVTVAGELAFGALSQSQSACWFIQTSSSEWRKWLKSAPQSGFPTPIYEVTRDIRIESNRCNESRLMQVQCILDGQMEWTAAALSVPSFLTAFGWFPNGAVRI